MANNEIPTLNFDIEGLTLKLCKIVQAAAELTNVCFAKVSGTCTEVHASLKLFELFEIFDINESTKILEHEIWLQVEVSPKINEVVSLIISSSVEDPKALKVKLMNSSSPEVELSIWMNLSRPSGSLRTGSSSGGPIHWPILLKSTVLSP
ncbi:hypothetical protein BY996DRAFT_6419539 [Phakopsora pachyrhizi]|nr:hypothetical protein BY996DRAFT_6419539 [Phakopsora pachyrhizi]